MLGVRALAPIAAVAAAALAPAAAQANTVTTTITTPGEKAYAIPAGTLSLQVEVVGAGGVGPLGGGAGGGGALRGCAGVRSQRSYSATSMR